MNHVFISYRQESAAHADQVRKLAVALQDEGIPVALDHLYAEEHPGGPDGGWAPWCLENAKSAACVLIVCSKGWFEAAEGNGPADEGRGVATEARALRTQLYRNKGNNVRIRLVVLDDGFDEELIPDDLYGWSVFKPFSNGDQQEQLSRWVRQRLAMTSGGEESKMVYLADCKFDLRTERTNLANHLQTAGWQVRPQADAKGEPKSFEADLRESLAFVQLLESYPREDGSHRTQLEQARQAVPCIRFCHAKVQVEDADVNHRAFLTENDVIRGGFDDFKLNLVKDLEAIWNKKHAPKPYASRDLLVRVAIRAAQPDPLWEEVFNWVDSEPGIRPALIEGSESFKDKHDPAVPCHGFMIICDRTVEEGANSAKTDLEQCMQIQLGVRQDTRRPPVAMIFWPPPETPKWPRLMRVVPPKTHRVLASRPADLKNFFEDVRRCGS